MLCSCLSIFIFYYNLFVFSFYSMETVLFKVEEADCSAVIYDEFVEENKIKQLIEQTKDKHIQVMLLHLLLFIC